MIIDTFPFNRDFLSLEIRLHELGDSVDLFIIAESEITHSGIPKPLYLTESKHSLGRFRDKIQIVVPKIPPYIRNPRTREMIQRQSISKFLENIKLKPTDLIIHSDCDEIPRSSIINEINNEGVSGSYLLELDHFSNSLNLFAGKWARARVVRASNFVDIQQMRKDIFLYQVFTSKKRNVALIKTPDFWSRSRFFHKAPGLERRPSMVTVPNAGWHFNNLMNENDVIHKVEASCHTELNVDSIKSVARERFRLGLDIYTGEELVKVEINDSYPEHIYRNLDRWLDYIR